MKKGIKAILTAVAVAAALCGCTKALSPNETNQEENKTLQESKILKTAESFALQTLNPHMDYQGWYTSIYGVTESLFVMNDQSDIAPLLAEKVDQDGSVWTIHLKDEAAFSNGKTLTAEMVIRNLKQAGETNSRFSYLTDYKMEPADDKTIIIDTGDIYPTLLNDLASPELAMVDLDASKDFSSELVATGPFVVSSFIPGGTVEVVKNDQYWNGEVALDGAVFYYMPEPDTAFLAMQNGEIDSYTSVPADAAEWFQTDKDTYKLATVPATRLQFYILNQNRLNETVRKAINLIVDREEIETYLNGSVTKTEGPFGPSTEYGKVTGHQTDEAGAKALLEEAGYKTNSEGYYEKDGEVLTLKIAYYASRSLDTVSQLVQEQLRKNGIKGVLVCEEDPDGTYIATGDFDIAFYCMIADKAGDPYYFISCTLSDGAPYNCGGFKNQTVQSNIEQLKTETVKQKRAELANEIIQTAIDEDAFGYVALFNKTTVMRKGITNVSETCPFDFYFLNANTDMSEP